MSEVKEHRLKKIELDAKCIDELVCKLASGKEKWSMSIPPQDFDTDMMLIRPVRDYIPELLGYIKNLQKENAILRDALELAVKSGEFFSRHADCRNDSWSCRCEFCKDNSASKNLREARQALEKVKSEKD